MLHKKKDTKDTKDTKNDSKLELIAPAYISTDFMENQAKNLRIEQLQPISLKTEDIGKSILDAAYKVHSALGSGLLESVYQACLIYKLNKKEFIVEAQVALPIKYEGIKIDTGVRLDVLVEKCVIIEIKTVDNMIPVYKAQLLTYLKLSGIRLGYLINFNTIHLRNGITRVVN